MKVNFYILFNLLYFSWFRRASTTIFPFGNNNSLVLTFSYQVLRHGRLVSKRKFVPVVRKDVPYLAVRGPTSVFTLVLELLRTSRRPPRLLVSDVRD